LPSLPYISEYPDERLVYALFEQNNTTTDNQSSSISILNKKGLDLLSSASYNEAITYFDKILAINSTDATALNNKAFTLYSLGKYNEAVVYYDKAIAIRHNYASALDNKGLALNDLGKYSDAMTHYIILIQFKPILSNLSYGKLVRYLNELEMKEKNPLWITEKGRYFIQDYDRTRI
jgi:tetratricopeptide (TPR) repeat protein